MADISLADLFGGQGAQDEAPPDPRAGAALDSAIARIGAFNPEPSPTLRDIGQSALAAYGSGGRVPYGAAIQEAQDRHVGAQQSAIANDIQLYNTIMTRNAQLARTGHPEAIALDKALQLAGFDRLKPEQRIEVLKRIQAAPDKMTADNAMGMVTAAMSGIATGGGEGDGSGGGGLLGGGGGKSDDERRNNRMIAYVGLYRQGKTTPQQDAQYALDYANATAGHYSTVVVDGQPKQVWTPSADLNGMGFPSPKGFNGGTMALGGDVGTPSSPGGGTLPGGGRIISDMPGKESTDADKLNQTMAEDGAASLEKAWSSMTNPDGTIDRATLLDLQQGLATGHQLTGKARMAMIQLESAMENKLRLSGRGGRQLSKEQLDRYVAEAIPSPTDSDAVARARLDSVGAIFKAFTKTPGPSAGEGAQPPAGGTATAGGGSIGRSPTVNGADYPGKENQAPKAAYSAKLQLWKWPDGSYHTVDGSVAQGPGQ